MRSERPATVRHQRQRHPAALRRGGLPAVRRGLDPVQRADAAVPGRCGRRQPAPGGGARRAALPAACGRCERHAGALRGRRRRRAGSRPGPSPVGRCRRWGTIPPSPSATCAARWSSIPSRPRRRRFGWWSGARSLSLIDSMSDKDRREIERATQDEVLESSRFPEITYDCPRSRVTANGGAQVTLSGRPHAARRHPAADRGRAPVPDGRHPARSG